MRETVFLNTDREMPLLGLGVYKTADNEAETAITAAVDAGYRLIDTASAYKNEESVGKAIAKCGIPRKELFITSKIWNNAQRLGDVDGAFYRSMERLKLDYLDLYLIHWPVPGCPWIPGFPWSPSLPGRPGSPGGPSLLIPGGPSGPMMEH